MGIDNINVNSQVYGKAAPKAQPVKEVKIAKPNPAPAPERPAVKQESKKPSIAKRVEEQTKENLEDTKKVKMPSPRSTRK